MRAGTVARRVAFSLAPLALLLGVGELVVRATWHPPVSNEMREGIAMVPHSTRIWALPPGTGHGFAGVFVADENGFRMSEHTGAPVSILTTGDSSIFGHGLADADTLHAALARQFAGMGLWVDAGTIAVPGYSTEQTLVALDEVGWSLEPDLLVIGNLWSDNGIRYFSDREWLASLQHKDFGPDWFLQHVQLLRFLKWQVSPPETESLPVGWVRDPYATGRRRVPVFDYAQNLDKMLMGAAERDISAVMLSPCNDVLIGTDGTFQTAWDPYFFAMSKVAERRGVPVVAACRVLQHHGLSAQSAFLDQMHPTAFTNQLYAGQLARVLTSRGWPLQPIAVDGSLPLWSDDIPETWDVETQLPIGDPEQRKDWVPVGPPSDPRTGR